MTPLEQAVFDAALALTDVKHERREERDSRAQRDLPILDAFDRMAHGSTVPYTPGPRHAPKLDSRPRHPAQQTTAATRSTRVYAARVDYIGLDRLDVTRKSAGLAGLPFAPSWRILGPMIALRRSGGDERAAWPGYAADYTAEMRASFRASRPAWDALLARDEVTLVCYCADPAFCHRTLLAEILSKLGAKPCGERVP